MTSAQASTEELQEKHDTLVNRLNDGSEKILLAKAQGRDVSKSEDKWIALLREYERVYDALHP